MSEPDTTTNLEGYIKGYLLAAVDDTARGLTAAIVTDLARLAGYCNAPHPDTETCPDLRCTRHHHHAGDHGGFPTGLGQACVPIRWRPESSTLCYCGLVNVPPNTMGIVRDGTIHRTMGLCTYDEPHWQRSTMVPTDTQGARHDDSTRSSVTDPPEPAHDA